MSKRYQNPDVLQELYYGEGLSLREVGDRLGCSESTVIRYMEKHGIDRKDRLEQVISAIRIRPAWFGTTEQGYELWTSDSDGDRSMVFVHKLLAICEGYDPSNVFDRSYDVHHKNGVPWDNRPENIELLRKAEHTRAHTTVLEEPTRCEIRERYSEGDVTYNELATEYGVSKSAISYIISEEADLDE